MPLGRTKKHRGILLPLKNSASAKVPCFSLLFIITVHLTQETKLILRFAQLIAESRGLYGKEKMHGTMWPKCYKNKLLLAVLSEKSVLRVCTGLFVCLLFIFLFKQVEVLAAVQLMWTCYTHPPIYSQRTATTPGISSPTLLD